MQRDNNLNYSFKHVRTYNNLRQITAIYTILFVYYRCFATRVLKKCAPNCNVDIFIYRHCVLVR